MASRTMPSAVLDACVLFPALLRDTLLSTAEAGLYAPFWSQEILEEVGRNLRVSTQMKAHQVDYALGEMRRAFPEACIDGYERHLPFLNNHPKDRHVVAAAVEARASQIITLNLRDFRQKDLPAEVTALSPDLFLLGLLEDKPQELLDVLARQAAAFTRKPVTLTKLLQGLAKSTPQFSGTAAKELGLSPLEQD